MTDDEAELVMPFVTVASVGGPHDDASYAAGWSMGVLDTLIQSVASAGVVDGLLVAAENRQQADLIAMRHGWQASFTESDDGPEWLYMTLTREEPADG